MFFVGDLSNIMQAEDNNQFSLLEKPNPIKGPEKLSDFCSQLNVSSKGSRVQGGAACGAEQDMMA